MIRDAILENSHYENNCLVWDGKLSDKFGPIITIAGHSRSVRRVLYEDLHLMPLDKTKVFRAIDGKCHWKCINLQHFYIADVPYYRYA